MRNSKERERDLGEEGSVGGRGGVGVRIPTPSAAFSLSLLHFLPCVMASDAF